VYELEKEHTYPALAIGSVGDNSESPSAMVLGDKLGACPFNGLHGSVSPGLDSIIGFGQCHTVPAAIFVLKRVVYTVVDFGQTDDLLVSVEIASEYVSTTAVDVESPQGF